MTTIASPLGAPFALVFSANGVLLTRALGGVTDAQAWSRPVPQANPMLWIAGHVVATRAAMIGLLGEPTVLRWGSVFARGAVVGGDLAAYPSRAVVLQAHEDLTPRIDRRLRELTAADLEREATGGPKPPGVTTVGDQIGFFARHDAYHIGQLAILWRALGFDGLVG